MTQTALVNVDLPGRSYPIQIGNGILAGSSFLSPLLNGKTCLLISDSNVAPRYLEKTLDLLQRSGAKKVDSSIFPAGEESKQMETVLHICRKAAQIGLDRKSVMLALGGGVTGDMTGFAAAIYMRGIDFIQIPTTLLAMVDSSVGGKTGVDIPEGKNLLGAFHQPKAVLIDTEFLQTLPFRQYLCGVAEILKTAAILDADFFQKLEQNIDKIRQMDPVFTGDMVKRCCELKASVVIRDEREGSLRAILNYGHTFGHAVESSSGFTLPHGEAVAVGICMACELAVSQGIMSRKDADRQTAFIRACGLPTEAKMNPKTVFSALFNDKKTLGGILRFVLTPEIGKAEVRNIAPAAVQSILEHFPHA